MIRLKPVQFKHIQQWFWEFQKKSKCFEMPPEHAEYLGIFDGDELIGYFIIAGYNKRLVEINQGYLKPKSRHKNLPSKCVNLLEDIIKKAGYTQIKLCTQNRFRSYIEFMKQMNYKPERLIFSKNI